MQGQRPERYSRKVFVRMRRERASRLYAAYYEARERDSLHPPALAPLSSVACAFALRHEGILVLPPETTLLWKNQLFPRQNLALELLLLKDSKLIVPKMVNSLAGGGLKKVPRHKVKPVQDCPF